MLISKLGEIKILENTLFAQDIFKCVCVGCFFFVFFLFFFGGRTF